MSLQNLLNQFMGSSDPAASSGNTAQGIGNTVSKLSSNIPGGLVGGAAAGGIMTLLVGNKSARKFAGKAATYGGAAMLGGLALKAFQNWQQNSSQQTTTQASAQNGRLADEKAFAPNDTLSPVFELTLIKAMIAATKADGHIDATEQQNIFKAMEQMDLSTEMKATMFDLLRQPISVGELAKGIDNIEQKSEIYLVSCLVINPDHPSEQAHLNQLALALGLPQDFAQQLQWQAQQAVKEEAT